MQHERLVVVWVPQDWRAAWLDGLGVSQERFDVVLATQLVLMKVLFLGFEILLVDLVFSAGGACNRSNNGRAIRAN